jgi:cyclase
MTSRYFRLEQVGKGAWAAIVNPGTGAWGNAGIVDLGEQTLVFDTFMTAAAARELKAAAEALTGRPVSLVVNSHEHLDHVHGNMVFDGALVIATAETRALMAVRRPAMLAHARSHPEFLTEFAAQVEQEAHPQKRRALANELGEYRALAPELDSLQIVLPSLTFTDRLTLHGSARSAELIAIGPAHTAGDLVLWLPEERILFAGDVVQVKTHPWLGTGALSDWRRAHERLEKLEPAHIIPGHGPVGGPESLPILTDYLQVLERTALAHLATGGTAADVERIPLPESYAEWESATEWWGDLALVCQAMTPSSPPAA